MGFKCGIVGLPNVGKSTLFNALTKAGVSAANYPFCTIEPNVGMVAVPDLRLQALSAIVKPQQTVATVMQFVDIAGLVKGASTGEGLGNQFLAHIRETEAIAHVVRCFANSDVVHVEGRVDPDNDIEIINTELALADMSTVEKALNKATKLAKTGNKEALFEQQVLEKCQVQLNKGEAIRLLSFSEDEAAFLQRYCLLTAKPVLYIANVDEQGERENNPWLQALRQRAEKENAQVVVVCAAIEAELMELNEDERQLFMDDLGMEEPGLDRVIREGYNLLGLQTFFTAGVKEVRSWTFPRGATAPQAAGVIHTDFEKGFIRAEVMAYEDFIQYKGEQGAKEAGKLRLEGKDYIVRDGDVMHFRFNV